MAYAIPLWTPPALPIAGSDQQFPVRRIFCVGRNYAEHQKEMGGDGRETPFFFLKTEFARDQGKFGFQEEERRLAAVAAHLLLVLGVVASDAENAPHRKLLIRARYWESGRGPQGNCVGHRVPRKPAILFRVACRRTRGGQTRKRRAPAGAPGNPAPIDRLPAASGAAGAVSRFRLECRRAVPRASGHP